MSSYFRVRLLVLVILAASVGGPIAAQTPLGGEFQINTATTLDQEQVDVARSPSGDFFVVWKHSLAQGRASIRGQGYDPSGSPLGPEVVITPSGSRAGLAADASQDFLVVFSRGYSIFGRRFDAAGTPLGSEFTVNQAPYNVNPVSASSAADSSFVVVWDDLGIGGIHTLDVFGRRFDSSGSPLGGSFLVNSFTSGNQYSPKVKSAPSGAFVVVWQSSGQNYPFGGIYAQRYDASGRRLGGEFQVNSSTTGGQKDPAVAMDQEGNFIIVWESRHQGSRGIFGQRYDASGGSLGGEFAVSTYPGSWAEPAIATDAAGDFVVSWNNFFSGEVYAREFLADATPRSPESRVNSYTTSYQRQSKVASDAQGNYVVIWESLDQDGSGYGVFGQRFAAPGLFLLADGSCPGVLSVGISSAPPNSEVALIAAANTNGFVKGGELCYGAALEIGEPFALPPRWVDVDGEGNGLISFELDGYHCFLQALALADCSTSGVVQVPQGTGGHAVGAARAQ